MTSELANVRTRLLDDIGRWRGELGEDGQLRGTLEIGIGMNAVSQLERLLHVAVSSAFSEAQLSERPTMGELVNVVRKHGRAQRMRCIPEKRRLVTRGEFAELDRLTAARNALVHAGSPQVTVADVRQLVHAVESVARLRLFDELECRALREADGSTPLADGAG